MIAVLEGGTDAASMLIFDPAAMPSDYDACAPDDPMSMILELTATGRVYWLDTHGDGGYNLGVCLGETLDHPYPQFAKQAGVADHFAAPSGKLYFTGIEYAFHHDDSFLRNHSHMGSFQKIPRGTYRLALYEMEYPKGFHEDLLRQEISAVAFQLYSLMSWLAPLGCLSLLVLAISPFLFGLRAWITTALPICLTLIAFAVLMARLPPYREARGRHRAIQRDNPGFIAVLRPREA